MHEICPTGLSVAPLRWCRSSAAFWSSGLTAPPSSTPTPRARTSLSPSPFPPRAQTLSPWVRCIHTHTQRTAHVSVNNLLTLLPLYSARRLQSAKKDMQRSTHKEWWSPRCRRANPVVRNSSDELFASTASSPCPSPSLSPCPSPRPSISQALFKTKLQLVDLAGSECVGKKGAMLKDVLWIRRCHGNVWRCSRQYFNILTSQNAKWSFRHWPNWDAADKLLLKWNLGVKWVQVLALIRQRWALHSKQASLTKNLFHSFCIFSYRA